MARWLATSPWAVMKITRMRVTSARRTNGSMASRTEMSSSALEHHLLPRLL